MLSNWRKKQYKLYYKHKSFENLYQNSIFGYKCEKYITQLVRKAGVSRMNVVCRPSEARVTNHA